MKEIRISSITLTNFQGEKQRTVTFNQEVTTICGDNGLGKSRIFDAFLWLLFGKDALGRENYEIKTRINGIQMTKADCGVEAAITIDGEIFKLKRMWVEDWVKPRGCAEQTFKGNHTECWWNDVPVSVTDYTKRVNGLVDDSLFKMLTNPAYFPTLPWKTQREQLFALAGSSITDNEIAAGNSKFENLLTRLSGKTLQDYKKEQAQKKSLLKKELEQIQPRIEQTEKMTPQELDWDTLGKDKQEEDAKLTEIDAQLSDRSRAMRARYDAEQEKAGKITELKVKQQRIKVEKDEEAREAAYRQNTSRRDLESKDRNDRAILVNIDRKIDSDQRLMKRYKSELDKNECEMQQLRDIWHRVNASVYDGSDICPTCHQELPENMKADARALFDAKKAKQLADITNQGKSLKADADSIRNNIESLAKLMNESQANRDELAHTINETAQTLSSWIIAEPVFIEPELIPEWAELQTQIKALEATVSHDLSTDDTMQALAKERAEITAKRDETMRLLNTRQQITNAREEIGKLEERGRELSQQIADIENLEYTMQQFSKAKITECEKRINGMFTSVTFRLFDRTIDGNETETCVPLVNGVPWDKANSAGKINAGLDIINTLCRFYGITAPIFIDNRESINHPIKVESQVIYLQVTEDKEIRVI